MRRRTLTLVLTLVLMLAGSGPPLASAADPVPANPAFQRTWDRTDAPVASGVASRTWMWGPAPFTTARSEPYAEAPGGQRRVQYFDKARMEITHPDAPDDGLWYVTNGLLVVELMSGRVQLGDDRWEQREPARVNVAGDADDAAGPTYASLAGLRTAPPHAAGAAIGAQVTRDGRVTPVPRFERYGATAGEWSPATGHRVASVFWTFMTSRGIVSVDGQLREGPLFPNPYYATGLPVTEAYWATVRVGGSCRDVLLQCFERRCLTWTPENPPGWQVEAGNVGRHYEAWRYGGVTGDRAPLAIDARAWGALGDGVTDDSAALQRAIDAAWSLRAGGGGCGPVIVHLPAGEYRVRITRPKTAEILTVREGVWLVGDGRERSVLRAMGATMPSDVDGRLLLVESHALLRDLTVDGDAGGVPLPESTNVSQTLVRTPDGQRDCGFSNIEVRNQWAGGGDEGFGLAIDHSTGCWVRDSIFHGNMGTGLAVVGPGAEVRGTLIERVEAWHNGFRRDGVSDRNRGGMGISLYGTTDTRITDVSLHDNAGNGLNLEWSARVLATGVVTFGNLDYGISTIGWGDDITIVGARAWGNGVASDGEHIVATVGIRPGSQLAPRGVAQLIRFIDCAFSDLPGNPTFYINALAKPEAGHGFPTLVLDSADAASWTFRSRIDGGEDRLGDARAVLRYPRLIGPTLPLPQLDGWLPIGDVAQARLDPAVGGSVSGRAWLLASHEAGAGWRAPIEAPGARLLASLRLRPKTPGTWTLRFMAGDEPRGQLTLHFTAADVAAGGWLEPQLLNLAPFDARAVQLIARTAGAELWVELPGLRDVSAAD